MVSLAAIFVWRIKPYYVFLPWLTIACLDGTYLSSALTKVPDGAWVTLTIAAVLTFGFILWRFGKEQQWAVEAEDRFPTSHFVKQRENGQIQLTKKYGGGALSSIRGFGIFFDKAGETTPIVFSQFISKLVAAPEVMVFFHLRPLERPSVDAGERYTVSRLAIPNCYRVVLRHGYLDEVITPDLAAIIYEQVRNFIIVRNIDPTSYPQPMRPVLILDGEQENRHRSVVDGPLVSRPAAIEEDKSKTNNNGNSTTTATPMSATVPLAHATTTGSNTNATSVSFNLPITTTVGVPTPDNASTEPTTTSNANESSSQSKDKDKETRSSTTTSELSVTSLELSKLESAYSHQILYIIGKEQMKVKPNPMAPSADSEGNEPGRNQQGFWKAVWIDVKSGYWFRRGLLHTFLWVRENTRTKIANLRVPMDRVFEVGFIKEV